MWAFLIHLRASATWSAPRPTVTPKGTNATPHTTHHTAPHHQHFCTASHPPHTHHATPPAPQPQNNLERIPKNSAHWMAKHFWSESALFEPTYYKGLFAGVKPEHVKKAPKQTKSAAKPAKSALVPAAKDAAKHAL